MKSLFLVLSLLAATLMLTGQEPEENPIRALLNKGEPVIGATITTTSVDVAAHAAAAGFDFLWIEMEHSPISWETLRDMVLATRGLKAIPFVRVPANEVWTAKRALDAGALGVVFPFTSTPELAKRAATYTRYPPEGLRGSGPGLASFRWNAPEGYEKFANRNVMVVCIIEDEQGVNNAEEIAATPGVDVIFIGPNDLSHQLGVTGQYDHPKFKAAVDRIVKAAQKHNKPVGRTAASAEQVQEFVKQGFTFFQAPSDLNLMRSAARQLLDPLNKKGMEPATKSFY